MFWQDSSDKFRNVAAAALAVVGALGFGSGSVTAAEEPTSAQLAALKLPKQLTGAEADAGFKPIFDGKTLHGWDGDTTYWRVQNGTVVGETVEGKLPQANSMLIWRGGQPGDFELKFEYRISSVGNSGVQYRSVEAPGERWALIGYQFDLDGPSWMKMALAKVASQIGLDIPRVTGQIFDERGRAFLALPGQFSHVQSDKAPAVLATLESGAVLVRTLGDGWHRAHLVARGHQLVHIIDEQVVAMVIDDDAAKRRMQGLIGLQIHVGPPMKVEYRNIRIKL